jgi:signal transduction histidine kinase
VAGIHRARRRRPNPILGALWAAALVVSAAQAAGPATGAGAHEPLRWRTFSTLDGLAESWIGDVTIGPSGRLYITHGDVAAMSVYDGYAFSRLPSPGSNLTVREARDGQLWALLQSPEDARINIGVQRFDGMRWIPYPLPGVRPLPRGRRDFLVLTPGRLALLTAERLIAFAALTQQTSDLATADRAGLGPFLGCAPARGGGGWVVAARGLFRLTAGGALSLAARFPPTRPAARSAMVTEGPGGGVMVATETGPAATAAPHVYRLEGTALIDLAVPLAPGEGLLAAWGDVDGRWWSAVSRGSSFALRLHTGAAVHELPRTGAMTSFWTGVTPDPAGGMWIGTALGLMRHRPAIWRTPEGLPEPGLSVGAFRQTSRGEFVAIRAESLILSRDGRVWTSYPLPPGAESNILFPTALAELPDGRMAFGTGPGMRTFDPATGTFGIEPPPTGVRSVAVIGATKTGGAWIAADPGGLSSWLTAVGSRRPWPRIQGGQAWRQGSPRDVIETTSGDLYIAPDGTSVGRFRAGTLEHLDAAHGFTGSGALCGAEIAPGRFWFGDRDSILEFDGTRWREVRSGLQSVRSIVVTREGSIWVTSGTGLHRYKDGSWLSLSAEDGLPDGAMIAVVADRAGGLWVTSTAGMRRYVPEADSDAPDTRIAAQESTSRVPPGGAAHVLFGGTDKWDATAADRLLYSWRVDGGPWAPFSESTSAAAAGLPAGPHAFEVRAMDRNGNVDPTPASLAFLVLSPWYLDTGFLLLGIPSLLLIGGGIGLAVTRYLRLERLVADRTRALQEANVQIQHDAEARQRAEAQLHQAQKLEAIGRLAGGVAHDFNNVLTVISGYAEMLRGGAAGADDQRAAVEEIAKAADRASTLTRQLLAFGRHHKSAPEPLDLNVIVSDILRMLRRLIGEDVLLAFEPTPGLWPVVADRGQIERVLVNLAVNARDAMPEGGRLEIALENVDIEADSPHLHQGGRAGAHVRLRVADTGAGMDASTARRLFEPFFTTKASGKGTGLGLSVVYGIVAGTGGWIAVDSAPGTGTRFDVYLPRGAGAVSPASEPRPPAPAAGGHETILFVEDEPSLRALGVSSLRQLGYGVIEASSAEDAQAALEAAGGRVQLVVTDIVMTGHSGLRLSTWIGERWPSIRVLLMSGYAGDAVLRDGRIAADTPFLQKPFTPDTLCRIVRELLDRP